MIVYIQPTTFTLSQNPLKIHIFSFISNPNFQVNPLITVELASVSVNGVGPPYFMCLKEISQASYMSLKKDFVFLQYFR